MKVKATGTSSEKDFKYNYAWVSSSIFFESSSPLNFMLNNRYINSYFLTGTTDQPNLLRLFVFFLFHSYILSSWYESLFHGMMLLSLALSQPSAPPPPPPLPPLPLPPLPPPFTIPPPSFSAPPYSLSSIFFSSFARPYDLTSREKIIHPKDRDSQVQAISLCLCNIMNARIQ